jgi:hypothetical protein
VCFQRLVSIRFGFEKKPRLQEKIKQSDGVFFVELHWNFRPEYQNEFASSFGVPINLSAGRAFQTLCLRQYKRHGIPLPMRQPAWA